MKSLASLIFVLAIPGWVVGASLEYAPAPPDNPLRGLVPYASASGKAQFPHSMEFSYFALKDVMKGPQNFDWDPIERTLQEVGKRGNQMIFRIYCEYPGKEPAVPEFLVDAGVRITKWTNKTNGRVNHTPDYENVALRAALKTFINAMGTKYDGDPRVAFITAGLLGSWGEWHTFPRNELWASKQVQREVMNSYADAFSKTRILLRYPASPEKYRLAENHRRPFGYHDDSFCWATLDTGKKKDSWFFETSLKAAGATEKWKHHPIGGEIRPELWKTSFTANRNPRDQGFIECVERLHATWLMDSGLFDVRIPMDKYRKEAALRETARMGYEFHISKADWHEGRISLTVENRGVAPFYYDWLVEIEVDGKIRKTDWKLRGILPGKSRTWSTEVGKIAPLKIRVPNPMKGGKPLRFANRDQGREWLPVTP
jgi:hypothetical protein